MPGGNIRLWLATILYVNLRSKTCKQIIFLINIFCFSLGPDEMEILLQFMYGAIVDLPPGASARYCMWTDSPKLEYRPTKQTDLYLVSPVLSHSQVVLAADMLGLEGLKDVVEMVLTRDYCRFFPKVSYTEGCVIKRFSVFARSYMHSVTAGHRGSLEHHDNPCLKSPYIKMIPISSLWWDFTDF